MSNAIQTLQAVVVLFGSAIARFFGKTDRTPRDLDVLYANCEEAEAGRLARQWADTNGCEELKLDLHGVTVGFSNYLHVPVPEGGELFHIVLAGTPIVMRREFYGFSSQMRVHGGNVDALVAALAATANGSGHIRVDDGQGTETPEEYCEGIKALQNALTHVDSAVWQEVCRRSPIAGFLNALCTRSLTPEVLEFGRKHGRGNATHPSAAGGSELYLMPDGVGAHYSAKVTSYGEALETWFVKRRSPFRLS